MRKTNRHAYLIIAFNNWEVLEKLIRLLDHERNDIYIHINSAIRDFDFDYFEKIPEKSKVYYTERFHTEWGTPRLMVAQMYFLQMAHGIENYQYYHILSGACFPLKTQEEIHKFFDENNGKEFVHFTSAPPLEKRIYDRYAYDHRFHKHIRENSFVKRILFGVLLEGIYVKLQKLMKVDRQKKNPYEMCFGSSWFSITDEFAFYILEHWDYLLDSFKHTFAPDEIYVQTLAYNSKFKDRLYYDKMDDNYLACMRYIDWERGNPYTFTIDDYEELMDSGCLFARKFDIKTEKQRAIIDKIYHELMKQQKNV